MDESRGAVSGGGRGKRNSFRPVRSTVNNREEMSITGRRGKWTNKINMKKGKTLEGDRNMLRRNVNMAVSLCRLAGKRRATPGSDITRKVRPNIARGNEAAGGTNARMSQIMYVMKNCLAERLRNKRPEVTGRNITMERKTKD